jgi:hypothetical protein
VFVVDSALLKRVFSTTAQQAIFITPVTAGNNARISKPSMPSSLKRS